MLGNVVNLPFHKSAPNCLCDKEHTQHNNKNCFDECVKKFSPLWRVLLCLIISSKDMANSSSLLIWATVSQVEWSRACCIKKFTAVINSGLKEDTVFVTVIRVHYYSVKFADKAATYFYSKGPLDIHSLNIICHREKLWGKTRNKSFNFNISGRHRKLFEPPSRSSASPDQGTGLGLVGEEHIAVVGHPGINPIKLFFIVIDKRLAYTVNIIQSSYDDHYEWCL